MRLLVVEDTQALAQQIRQALEQAGHAVDVASDGETALHQGETEPYDAIVLDLGLPRLDGLSVLRQWRSRGMRAPILILTARREWTSKVEGLNAGADDYLGKPFAMGELVARVNALLRRAHGHAQAEIVCGDLCIDTAAQTVSRGGEPVRLTSLEYELLATLAHKRGQPVSKTQLTEHLYRQDYDRDSNTIEVIVSRLRRKVGEGRIETLRGQGYRLTVSQPPE